MDAVCPHCGTDNVEYIGTDSGSGADEYFCDDCQQHFIIDSEREEETENNYDEDYHDQQEAEGYEEEEQY